MSKYDPLRDLPAARAGSYYGEPIDSDIGQYISSNVHINRTCNKQD
jgi:hypothetical protein